MMNKLIDGSGLKGVVIFAHGSGIAMDHPFMEKMTEEMVKADLKVVRFEFPYMAERRLTGKKGFPDKIDLLKECFSLVIKDVENNILEENQPLYLAGKSLGGRVASIICEHVRVSKIFVFGYPFHPIKKANNLRISNLQDVTKNVHIFQGERDKLGDIKEVPNYGLNKNIYIEWITDGDHDLLPRVKSGVSHMQNLNHIGRCIKSLV